MNNMSLTIEGYGDKKIWEYNSHRFMVCIYIHVACLACDCNGCLKVSYPSSDTNNKKNDAFISIRMGIIQMKTIEPTYLSQMCGKIIGI